VVDVKPGAIVAAGLDREIKVVDVEVYAPLQPSCGQLPPTNSLPNGSSREAEKLSRLSRCPPPPLMRNATNLLAHKPTKKRLQGLSDRCRKALVAHKLSRSP
jgi:hypothetical protein